MTDEAFRHVAEVEPADSTALAALHVRTMLDTTSDAFVQTDAEGIITGWNVAATALTGWSSDEAIGRHFEKLIIPWRFRRENGATGQSFPGAPVDDPLEPVVIRARHRDGREMDLELSLGRMWWRTRWTHHAFLRDVTERRLAGLSRDRTESEHQRLTEHTTDLMSRHTLDGRILYVSPACTALIGMSAEELVGRDAKHLVHPEDLGLIIGGDGSLRTDSDPPQATFRLRHASGTWLWVETTFVLVRDTAGKSTELQLSTRNITERLARDAIAARQSRLESLGLLAAGLAHEINTPIQYVGDTVRFLADASSDLLSIVTMYREILDPESGLALDDRLARAKAAEANLDVDYLRTEVPAAVEQTLQGIERVAGLIRAMEIVSNPGSGEPNFADLNEALRATAAVVRHQVHGVADLRLELNDLPPVRCNVADVSQVFLNLIINAADAVEETGRRGCITIASAVEGAHVSVMVSDTGGGIPDELHDKLFDQFFTTKEVGRGTGQGLATAHAVVVEGHGGSLFFDTSNAGTTFTARLPIDGRASV